MSSVTSYDEDSFQRPGISTDSLSMGTIEAHSIPIEQVAADVGPTLDISAGQAIPPVGGIEDDSERSSYDRKSDSWETTVVWGYNEDVVRIYSSVPKHLRRLRKDERVTEVRTYSDPEAAEQPGDFTVPMDQWGDNPLAGIKRALSEETRAKMAENARERFQKQ